MTASRHLGLCGPLAVVGLAAAVVLAFFGLRGFASMAMLLGISGAGRVLQFAFELAGDLLVVVFFVIALLSLNRRHLGAGGVLAAGMVLAHHGPAMLMTVTLIGQGGMAAGWMMSAALPASAVALAAALLLVLPSPVAVAPLIGRGG